MVDKGRQRLLGEAKNLKVKLQPPASETVWSKVQNSHCHPKSRPALASLLRMSASVPSFTKSYHTSSYPALDPAQPDLSTNGKLVIVALGQGDGDKYSPAFAFLESGASRIAILGSGENSATALLKMKDAIETVHPSTVVQTSFVDIWSAESIATAAHNIRASLGAWDVFVQGSCYVTENTTLAGADTDEWWHIFELNIKFTHLFAKHFMPKARLDATYISFFSPATCGPASLFKGESAYVACQLATRRLNDYLAAGIRT